MRHRRSASVNSGPSRWRSFANRPVRLIGRTPVVTDDGHIRSAAGYSRVLAAAARASNASRPPLTRHPLTGEPPAPPSALDMTGVAG